LEFYMMQQCASKDFSKPNARIYSRGFTPKFTLYFFEFYTNLNEFWKME
jgi:hypothetical protein